MFVIRNSFLEISYIKFCETMYPKRIIWLFALFALKCLFVYSLCFVICR